MGEPVILSGKCFVNAVVEVLVMGENDMASHIIKLPLSVRARSEGLCTHEAFLGDIC